MKYATKLLLAAAVSGLFTASIAQAQTAPAPAPAAAPAPSPITGNMALVSNYRFRGIDQTFGKAALQGGIDFNAENGLYVGNWNSNVNEGAGYPAGNLEMDFYGGWKKTWGDLGLDVGYIYYYYPGSDANTTAGSTITNPKNAKTYNGAINNKEVYLGGSWKALSLKYFRSTGDYFSQPDTKGSSYLDLTATHELGDGWGVVGHLGKFTLKNWSKGTDLTNANYTDLKLGITKEVSGGVLGGSYITTSGKGNCNTAAGSTNSGYYCFANQSGTTTGYKSRNAASGVTVLSVSKTF